MRPKRNVLFAGLPGELETVLRTQLGVNVWPAACGPEAMQQAARGDVEFDLVIVDARTLATGADIDARYRWVAAWPAPRVLLTRLGIDSADLPVWATQRLVAGPNWVQMLLAEMQMLMKRKCGPKRGVKRVTLAVAS